MKIGKLISKLGYFSINKNKTFEWQFEGPSFMIDDVFTFNVSWTRNCHHAGFDFTFGVMKLFWININIHDNRHWDYENNTWEV